MVIDRSQSKGKIVLLIEAELIQNIPSRSRREYQDAFARASYIQSFLHEKTLPERRYENLIFRLPKDRLYNLLYESIPHTDLPRILMDKVPRERLIQELVRVLEPNEIEDILRELPEIKNLAQRKKDVSAKYNQAQVSDDLNKKGELLESVVRNIIELVPELKVTGSDINNGIEEIDLQVRNHNREHVWGDFEGMIFIECKNWSKPVGREEIDSFKAKLLRSGIHAGIFVATHGITGKGMEGAWGAIKMYLQEGFKIVVLDGKDIEEILNCKDVSTKVDEKFSKLYQ